MTAEDQERLQELEYLADFGELDEDDREELKELRSTARAEKRMAKALAKFDKARTVFKVTTPGEDDMFFLDLTTALKWTHEGASVEEIDRKTLTGRFAYSIIEGLTADDSSGRDEVYVNSEDEMTP